MAASREGALPAVPNRPSFTRIRVHVAALEAEIDQLVYALYGLYSGDIALVAGRR